MGLPGAHKRGAASAGADSRNTRPPLRPARQAAAAMPGRCGMIGWETATILMLLAFILGLMMGIRLVKT